MQRSVNVDVSGSTMPIVLVEPEDTASPFPGLILCHHREGIDEFTLDAGRRLAAQGFLVAIPNMYHRRPTGETWEVSRKTMRDLEVVADLRATTDFLIHQSFVRPDSIGIIGHCMGGRTALLGAAILPQIKSAVILYGGGIFRTEGEGMVAPGTLTGHIRATVLGLYGRKDHIIPVEEVDHLISTLKEHNIRHEFHLYENAGHAFQDFTRAKMFSPDASDDAWIRCFDFLKKTLHDKQS